MMQSEINTTLRKGVAYIPKKTQIQDKPYYLSRVVWLIFFDKLNACFG